MNRQRGVNYLLNKIQSLQAQNGQLRKQIRQRENFNRKLCSQNRKRRLKNNQLISLENDRLLQLKTIKGYEEEYKKIAVNLRKALKDSEQKLQQHQDQILILKQEISKQKKQSQNFKGQNKIIKRQLEKKTEEFERFMILQNQIAKKRIQTKKPNDEEEQIFRLVCQNQELQMKLKDHQKALNDLRHQIKLASNQIQVLKAEVENNQEIIKILRTEFEAELNQVMNKQGGKTASGKGTPNQSLIIVQAKNTSKPPLEQYGTKLTNKQQGYFYEIDHLLFSQNVLQNLTFNPITVYFCQQINLNKNHTWYTRIKLTGQGQINFGMSNSCFDGVEAMTIRNYIYYNNCSGLIVIDKQGKIIDQYATLNDTLTLCITIAQPNGKMKLYRNDKQIYECGVPEQLMRAKQLYPYIKLFQFMSIGIE